MNMEKAEILATSAETSTAAQWGVSMGHYDIWLFIKIIQRNLLSHGKMTW